MLQTTAVGLLVSGVGVSLATPSSSLADAPVPASDEVVVTTPPPAPCADVLLLAARGSGEGRLAPAGKRYGVTLTGFRRSLADALENQDRSLEQRALDFAAPTDRLLRARWAKDRTPAVRAITRKRFALWRAGVPTGVERAVAAIEEAATACPEQQIVLAGYAQGAMVMHRALLRVGRRPELLERIAGAALIADPDRKPALAARTLGAPAPRAGLGLNARFHGALPAPVIPGTPVGVYQVCTRGDAVCDTRTLGVRSALRTHRSYRHAHRVRMVAKALAARAGQWPLATLEPQRTAGQKDMLLDRPIRVRVTPAARDDLAFEAVDGLPAGISLTSDGRLRGVPLETGEFTVTFIVRNARPAFDRAVTGTLTLMVSETSARSISAGADQTCETSADGDGRCWGRNEWGQLGDGTRTTSALPVKVGAQADWASLSTNGSTTCGVKEDRSLWCWGLNQYGQVGDGTRTTRGVPTRIGARSDWATVSTGWGHTCATRLGGQLLCWGHNASGQLGIGSTNARLRPALVGDLDTWTSVSTGGWYTCGTTSDGRAWCWGANGFGQLGNGTRDGRAVPTQVGFTDTWSAVSASWATACGVKHDGELRCWGLNDRGQVGDGTRVTRLNPTLVAGGLRWSRVSVGDAHVCGVTDDARLLCWGDNTYGQLGTGARSSSATPVTSSEATGWYTVDAGWLHTCGIRQDGTSWCWGNNEQGQVGDGTRRDRRLVVPVS